MEPPSKFNFGRLFLGLFLVLVGAAYLIKLAGWLAINFNLWQFWPVILIYLGFSILSIRNWLDFVLGFILTFSILFLVGYLLFGQGALPESGDHTYKETIFLLRSFY